MAVITPNQTLSDANVVQNRSLVVSKTRPYSDLDLSLAIHPVFGDIVPLTDIDAVKARVVDAVNARLEHL